MTKNTRITCARNVLTLMQPKRSQLMLTLDRLLNSGWIDEAIATRKGISRLPCQIYRLRKKGYTILAIRNGMKTKYVIGEP